MAAALALAAIAACGLVFFALLMPESESSKEAARA
jgi:hypothetical protein